MVTSTNAQDIRLRSTRDDSIWLLLAAMLVLVLVFQIHDPFVFDWKGALVPAVFVAILQALVVFYSGLRPRPNIAATITGLQQMILFTALGSTLSYMVAAQGGGLWDEQLQAWDGLLSFDWLAYLHWTNAHPVIGDLFSIGYASLIPQMIAIIVVMGLSGRQDGLRVVLLAAMLTGLVTIMVSGLMPAMSNFVYHQLAPADYPNLNPSAAFVHVSDIEGLRSGTLRTLSLDKLEGIITFPSYHAGLAAAFSYAYFKMPYLRWPGLALAALTIAATPIDGGHYLVDVLAGIALAALSVVVARRCVTWRLPYALPRPFPAYTAEPL